MSPGSVYLVERASRRVKGKKRAKFLLKKFMNIYDTGFLIKVMTDYTMTYV